MGIENGRGEGGNDDYFMKLANERHAQQKSKGGVERMGDSGQYEIEGSLALKPKKTGERGKRFDFPDNDHDGKKGKSRSGKLGEIRRREKEQQEGKKVEMGKGTEVVRELTPEERKRLRTLARREQEKRKAMFKGTVILVGGALAIGGVATQVIEFFKGRDVNVNPDPERPESSQTEEYGEELIPSEQRLVEMTESGDGVGEIEIEQDVSQDIAETDEIDIERQRAENYRQLRQLAEERWISTEGVSANAYVPIHGGEPNDHDGITGPYGYNFAGRTLTQLRNDGWNDQEVTAFEVLTKKTGQEALDYINANPLTFTSRQMEIMKESNISEILDQGLERYRDDGLELLDLDPRIAVAALQPYGLYGKNANFDAEAGKENVYGDLVKFRECLKNEDWVGALDNYVKIIERYWANSGEKFNVGWGNRFNVYLQNDLLPGLIETSPELESELSAVAERLDEVNLI